MSNSFNRPIYRTLSGVTTPNQSGPGSDGNEEVLRIPQNSSITEASTSDYLVSGESYPSAEMQGMYYVAPADLAKTVKKKQKAKNKQGILEADAIN